MNTLYLIKLIGILSRAERRGYGDSPLPLQHILAIRPPSAVAEGLTAAAAAYRESIVSEDVDVLTDMISDRNFEPGERELKAALDAFHANCRPAPPTPTPKELEQIVGKLNWELDQLDNLACF